MKQLLILAIVAISLSIAPTLTSARTLDKKPAAAKTATTAPRC